ncbi:allophanate hydrolase subunit 1 [Clostridium aceticum]|uniref:Allophanate hydrolase subunit 1 n=1 Tax=Clostridium aceticum TaxID=84022 RepID=A0A0D8IC97_9CLOT|nr:5-oxoprolinase subunit PxpB [Clostridium aceticum]AKL94786.1 allophanate hydrolase subunit 1 [Clostridium aceticum]KJF27729.1 allophanate hydrolase [Clostridium aceticum]
MKKELNIYAAGDNGLIIEFGQCISEEINREIRSFLYYLEIHTNKFEEIVEIIPTYTTLFILYNPLVSTYQELVDKLSHAKEEIFQTEIPEPHVIHIPVLYGKEYGPDLAAVAQHNDLSVEEVIAIHSSRPYLIYMIGFTPGFPYLGGMSEKIATPRLKVPRQKISAGSVGIAGKQTGIYPIDSPGGWQVIGRTPAKLFDPSREPAVLLKVGDYLVFEAIDDKDYKKINQLVEKNQYQAKITKYEEWK